MRRQLLALTAIVSVFALLQTAPAQAHCWYGDIAVSPSGQLGVKKLCAVGGAGAVESMGWRDFFWFL